MGKQNKQQSRAAKTGKKNVQRRNQRNQYSPKPSKAKAKRRPWPLPDTPPTAREMQSGAEALMALLLMGARSSRHSMPWLGREYTRF